MDLDVFNIHSALVILNCHLSCIGPVLTDSYPYPRLVLYSQQFTGLGLYLDILILVITFDFDCVHHYVT